MKKIFTLLAVALCAIGVNAQTPVSVTWAMDAIDCVGVADPSTAAADIEWSYGAGFTCTGTSTYQGVTLVKFDQNCGDNKGTNSLSSAKDLNKYVEFKFTPNGGSFSANKITFDIVKNGTGDPAVFAEMIDGEGTVTTIVDNATIVRNNETGSPTHTVEVNSASSEGTFALRIYAGKLASGKSVSIANVVIQGELISADAPVLGVNPGEITLRATPWERTVAKTVTLSGKNLTDGEYTVTVPNVAGLSIEPASFTVAEGVVSQEFTLTYSSEVEVAPAVASFKFQTGEKEAELAVSYSSKGSLTALKAVSDDTEWNFEQLTETIELSDQTVPTSSDWVVYADFESINFPEGFKANSIAFKGQFPTRNKKAQAGTLKIKVGEPGTLSVDFSDTGASGDGVERYLAVNGNINLVIFGEEGTSQYYTKRDGTNDRKEAVDIAVMPGEVTIGALQEEVDGEGQKTGNLVESYVCFYKLTYTWNEDVTKGTPTGIAEVTAVRKADSAIYNLAGQRVERAVKGLYIQNGKKYVVK